MSIAELGGGSWLIGMLQIIIVAIAIFNIGTGCLLTVERILKSFGSKAHIWMWVYIIITTLGIVILKTMFERS